uniref:Uncharacterized protein n=1 Tax=Rhizophora mucronata TaxID=61149 RepID=A0A2P2IZI8_RHIMU
MHWVVLKIKIMNFSLNPSTICLYRNRFVYLFWWVCVHKIKFDRAKFISQKTSLNLLGKIKMERLFRICSLPLSGLNLMHHYCPWTLSVKLLV